MQNVKNFSLIVYVVKSVHYRFLKKKKKVMK